MLKQMGALGLIGANLPEEYGGLGESNVTSGITPGIGAISTPTVTSGTPGGFPRRD
jgi:alkylation response protein AidB-like acyl-CoA dehydrogenase